MSEQSVSSSPSISVSDPPRKPDDDWSGVTDPVERRRRQNRLNQRAYRQRKRQQQNRSRHATRSSSPTGNALDAASATSDFPSLGSRQAETLALARSDYHGSKFGKRGLVTCYEASTDVPRILELFSSVAYESYVLGCPTADHLLTLTKVNVYRAFVKISMILGLKIEDTHDDSISQFSTPQPSHATDESSLPMALHPTPIQRQVPHHPWLDFFPHSKMRDNLITAVEQFDDEELCVDILGFWNPSSEDTLMMVWGDPTNLQNWEVSERFIKKWGWTIRGCRELLQSTNQWRMKRGERPIFRYL